MRRNVRVAAYGVCVRDGRILLARWTGADGPARWTLPGGGMEHGEDPYDTVVREVEEETGYRVEPVALLGVDSARRTIPRRSWTRPAVDHQAVRVIYEVRITGGELRPELNGSTDLAAWYELSEVASLTRVPYVETALRLWRERPPTGRAGGLP
ncbi:8-oxo-dGTP diphosphatase [Streptomyces sp. B3I7]|uniref:NUDIX hydrolase n=1 Tax=Streptomyces sp. B3I7 TaxID=3042269 RepID=UPI00278A8DEB|nr:NUDIX hydrolase [Streptomyces sp. B3I7]MDQ0813409.1 8-oxo-dGTP diphosphatase [Streptomyces sp. B3I7]